ncbi:MAG: hypothetical protein DI603_23130 [Roseateles depolymerans]|uniref:Uncharacterized protein n=1 Tax=Roseateles depolymerans TaxID=76731 RepID=A0A2W5FBF4_9BURK|nr:MAG: hypothetical protein DI603_23130 [Roseateles depolymerans]
MNPQPFVVSACAALSCLGWITMFAAKKSGKLWLGNCFGIVYHIALAPVVQALPAPEFVRMAGYCWIFSDALIDVASINGMSEENVWALRMGVHIPASIWIAGSSLHMTAVPRSLGLVLGTMLALHAVVGPKIPDSKFKLFIFVLPCMAAWLGMIALGA